MRSRATFETKQDGKKSKDKMARCRGRRTGGGIRWHRQELEGRLEMDKQARAGCGGHRVKRKGQLRTRADKRGMSRDWQRQAESDKRPTIQ